MTKVEQVARVMAVSQGQDFPDPVPSHGFYVALWGRYMEMARAAILTMREPTEAMVYAGVEAKTKLYEKLEAQGTNTRTLLVANHPAGTIYEAMIDAALSETSEES